MPLEMEEEEMCERQRDYFLYRREHEHNANKRMDWTVANSNEWKVYRIVQLA